MGHVVPEMCWRDDSHRQIMLLKGFNPMIKPMHKTWLVKPVTEKELKFLPEEIKKKVTATTMHFLAYSYFEEEKEKYLHF